MLPERPLDCVADYLSFGDICAWSCSSPPINAFLGKKLSTLKVILGSVLDLPVCAASTASVLRRCHALAEIDLMGAYWTSDDVLRSIGAGCPLLRSIDLANLSGITDEGVRALSHSRCAPKLQRVNLVCCAGTTYKSALLLYTTGGDQLIVWRVPRRCTGVYHCPWGEQHIYYSDGSFDYQRADLTVGWVSHVVDHGDDSR
jgi:hypothetical protein